MHHSHAGPPGEAALLASLDGEEILFDPVRQSLYALSPIDGAAWLGWREAGAEGAKAALARLGVPPAQAASQASSLIDEWTSLGLLDPEPGALGDVCVQDPQQPPRAEALPQGAKAFAAGKVTFAIACPDACGAAIEGLLGAMATQAERVNFAFSVTQDGAGYALRGPLRSVKAPNVDALVVALKNEILESLLDLHPQLIALHTAALSGPQGAILLAGTSGSGKTTLAATLHAHGLSLIADDVALLDSGHGALTGLPFAFALKPGSWPVLASTFPDLESLPPRTRPDGKIVRYLLPASTVTAAPVAQIVFPKFTPGASLTIEKTSKRAALVHLLNEARNGARNLSAEGFNALCRTLQGAEVVTLRYDRADLAAGAILKGFDAQS